MRRRVFVYGTLEIPEVVRALIGRVPAGELKSRSFFFRLAVQVARLLSPVL